MSAVQSRTTRPEDADALAALEAEHVAEIRAARAAHLPGCRARAGLEELCRCRHLRGEVPPPAADEDEDGQRAA